MLGNLVQFGHGATDLVDPLGLFSGSGGDFFNQPVYLFRIFRDFTELVYGAENLAHGFVDFVGNITDLVRGVSRGIRRAHGQIANLTGHHREAGARFTGPRGLHCRVQCQ